jgi:hypothetical protein
MTEAPPTPAPRPTIKKADIRARDLRAGDIIRHKDKWEEVLEVNSHARTGRIYLKLPGYTTDVGMSPVDLVTIQVEVR